MGKDFYTHEEMLNKYIGAKETPERDEYDLCLELSLIGHKVKELREPNIIHKSN